MGRAAAELLDEVGYDALTIEAVARRAGVSRGALYRRWPNKGFLVYEVLLAPAGPGEVKDSGDLIADLRQVATDNAASFRDPKRRAVVVPLIADLLRDPRLAEELRRSFFGPRSEQIGRLIRAAVARGDATTTIPPEFVPAALSGPMLYSLVVRGKPATDEEIAALVAALVHVNRVGDR
ncbi:MAG: transcriptional regulator, TetR family [Acidimicrobiales bacterium]|nr:transcriptional regulator, TetR family [Acidimicrobiales bacterium]